MKHLITLFFAICIMQALYGQRPEPHSRYAWLYPMTPRFADWNATYQSASSPADSFPLTPTVYDSLQKILPTGLYALKSVIGRELVTKYLEVSPFDAVQVVAAWPFLRVRLSNPRTDLRQVRLRMEGREFSFDSVTQTFTCPIHSRRFDHAALEVICADGTLAFFVHQQRGGKQERFVIPSAALPVLAWQDPYRQKACLGYLMFDKPIYKPGDTARFKAFVTTGGGKPLTDTLTICFSQQAKQVSLKIAPARPGAYTGEYVFPQSAGFRLDEPVRAMLMQGKKTLDISQQIGYEAYKLRELTFGVKIPQEWRAGDSLLLEPEALGPDGRPAPDTRVKITVFHQHTTGWPAPGEQVYLPDTLFRYEGPVQAVTIPAGGHPALTSHWELEAVFTGGDNAQKTVQKFLTSSPRHPAPVRVVEQDNSYTQVIPQDSLKMPDSWLKVAYVLPEQAAPGAEVEVTIRVTDQAGKPVAGADVAAVGINAQFDHPQASAPSAPLMRPAPSVVVREVRGALAHLGGVSSRTALRAEDLRTYGLADSLWYRLMFPDSLETVTLPLPGSSPGTGEVAPFICHNGQQEEVVMVSCSRWWNWDRVLLYNGFCPRPYSFVLGTKDTWTLYVRTREAVYTIAGIQLVEGRKLILSLNPEHLPRGVTRTPATPELTAAEARELNAATLSIEVLGNSLRDSVFVWREGYLNSGYSLGPVSAYPVRISPVLPDGVYHIALQGKWQRQVTIRPGLRYTFSDTETLVKEAGWFTAGMVLPTVTHGFEEVAPLMYQPRLDVHSFLPPGEGTVLTDVQAAYQADQALIAFQRCGDSANLWLAPELSSSYWNIRLLPPGWYNLVFDGGFRCDSVEIRAGYTLIHALPIVLRKDTALLTRLHEPMGVYKGLFLNDGIAFGDSTYTGTVVDSRSQQPVGGAVVLLMRGNHQVAGTTTDSLGRFSFSNMTNKRAEIVVVKEGFLPGETALNDRVIVPVTWVGTDCNDPLRFRQAYPFDANTSYEAIAFRLPFRIQPTLSVKNSGYQELLQENIRYLLLNPADKKGLFNKGPGQIVGQVLDEHGQPAQDATVLIVRDGQVRYGMHTNADGKFALRAVESGFYHLTVRHRSVDRPMGNLYVTDNQKIDLVIAFDKPMAISASQAIEKTEVPLHPVIRRVPAVISTVSGREFRRLGSRNINTIASLTPGVYAADDGGAISVRGARESNTIYYIDGVKVRGNANLPQSSIKQMQVITGGTPAEFGDFTGGSTSITQDQVQFQPDAQDMAMEAFETLRMRTHFSDGAWWQPLLMTDSLGEARFTVRLPDDITTWNGYAIAMTAHRQAGTGQGRIVARKAVVARLAVPDFLTAADTVQAIGRVIGQPGDTLPVVLRYGQTGHDLVFVPDTIRGSVKRTFLLVPGAGDTTLRAEFAAALADQTADGEQRSIPVFPVGAEDAFWRLMILSRDSAMVFTPPVVFPEIPKDSALVSVSAGDLLPLLRQVEMLRKYPYLCNEQASSKLAGLNAGRAIDSLLGNKNHDKAEIRRLVKRLCDTQNPSGLWGWFPGMQDHVWLSALILRRIYAVDTAAVCIPKAKEALRTAFLTYPTLTPEVRMAVLAALAETHTAMDYGAALATITPDTTRINALASLGTLKAVLGLPFSSELERIMRTAKPTLRGGLFLGSFGWEWYGNGWETSLLTYRMLLVAGDSAGRAALRRGMIEQLSTRHLNTLQAATLLETLLPDLLREDSLFLRPSLTVKGGGKDLIVNTFPAQFRVKAGEPLILHAHSLDAVYVSYDQMFWNPSPVPHDSLFRLSSHLEQAGKSVTFLRAGSRAELVVTADIRQAGTHLALDIPIPAGCIYAAKPQYHTPGDCYREYQYHKTTIFMESLNVKQYTWRIPLEVRFEGNFVLNPARIHAMYMPHKQGNNAVTRVEIR